VLFRSLPLAEALHLQSEADVLGHGQVGPEGVTLKHEAEATLRWRQGAPCVAGEGEQVADANLPCGRNLEPGDHSERGRLSAAGGAEEGGEGTVGNLEVELPDGADVSREHARDTLNGD
jgi:hypothetical protein